MDPLTAGALATTVVPLVSGAAGEAGKQAWASLVGFVRARFGPGAAVTATVEAVEQQPADRVRADALAQALARHAADDPEVDAWLRSWLDEAAPLARTVSQVANVITGNATVHGPVLQAHTITGSVNLSAPPPPAT